MLVAVIVALIILLLVINNHRAENRKQGDDLQVSISLLRKEIKELDAQLKRISNTTKEEVTIVQPKTELSPVPAPKVESSETPTPVYREQTSPPKQVPQKETPVISAPPRKPAPEPIQPEEGWYEKWLKNNPDIEKFIGENLINKIGIGVLILGIAFFVKYAIDNEWINKTGRVAIGILCGAILISLAHRLRNGYRSFSSVLAGGGITVFYFTIAFAFHQYQLLSQTVAFIVMVVITAFAVALSVLYNRIELGILATVGGFITPFLVNNGSGNYIALFTYLSILNIGLLVLAYYKKWKIINYIAFFFTLFIYGGWLTNLLSSDKPIPTINGLIFASIFYLLFVAMQIINNIREGNKFKEADFSMLLLINVAYYTAGMLLLSPYENGQWKGLFTAGLGLVNLIMAWVFYKQNRLDKNFVLLLIGLTLSFISLAAPVQLKGNYITLFWAAEMVLLFWFYQKTNITLIKIGASIVLLLCMISLLIDWGTIYGSGTLANLPVIINKGFITGLAVVAALIILYRLLSVEANTYYLGQVTVHFVRQFVSTLAIILLFITGLLETHYQVNHLFPSTGVPYIWTQAYVVLFVLASILVLPLLKLKIDPMVRLLLPMICLLLYIYNMANIYDTEITMLVDNKNRQQMIGHWISVLAMLSIILLTINYYKKHYQIVKSTIVLFTWIAAISLVILFSVELRNLFVWLNYDKLDSLDYAENLYSKAGLSIVWGLSSFMFIWLGLKYKFKPLRIVALVLFGTTLFKLFSYDIRNIPAGGKILAFVLLGVLLLTVSFMYQRLKKILIDDSTEKANELKGNIEDQSS